MVKRHSTPCETHLRAMGHYLLYEITQYYLLPDTGEHALHNSSQKGWHLIYLPQRDGGWVGWLNTKMVYPPAGCTVTHPSINRALRRVTTLIKTNALPLSQATIIVVSSYNHGWSPFCLFYVW